MMQHLESAALLQGVYISQFLSLGPSVLLYYDYLLMLPTEVDVFWMRLTRISIASALVITNRYLSLLGSIPAIFEYFGDMSDDAVVAALLILRTFANVISSTLVARLMLSLRDSDRKPVALDGEVAESYRTGWSIESTILRNN
ncbi:hypothetical protein CERSUDRAFT_77624 [Gelatoporia subvermispora B]|uniref:DUF6533 domain-containing protein n=1 Tax=Ceriporiopsis subvermispora (strain B) TaxID=914234 RepID=M2QZM7_CERS8|nr:hypothetical protein CERSUDRAFT_77624 [Gelatoporia subvermispora B]